MQAAPAPQINVPNRELNLVAYPDFSGGDQDPMTWLDEVEKAFAANLINDDRKIPIIVPHLRARQPPGGSRAKGNLTLSMFGMTPRSNLEVFVQIL